MITENVKLAKGIAECLATCNYCFDACLKENDVKMMVGCIRMCKDCSQVCNAALALVYDGSNFVDEILVLCADACDKCAEECGRHKTDHTQKCAQVCMECAAMCREFVA